MQGLMGILEKPEGSEKSNISLKPQPNTSNTVIQLNPGYLGNRCKILEPSYSRELG
jgi:hypothetical protein